MRFVVLKHTGTNSYKPGVHWDLLCETEQGLRAWECPGEPFATRQQSVRELPLHRAIYLDYEGPISGDRGTVERVVEGTYDLRYDSHDRFEIQIESRHTRGNLNLARDMAETLIWQMEWSAENSAV